MTSQEEESLSTQFIQNKKAVVSIAFSKLISDDPAQKKEVRDLITSSEWFDGEGILLLAHKIMKDHRGGWGRAKRTAITSWYLNRPLELVTKQITEFPSIEKTFSHVDVISFLHLCSDCKNEDQFYYFYEFEKQGHTYDEPTKPSDRFSKSNGFWSFIEDLLGLNN